MTIQPTGTKIEGRYIGLLVGKQRYAVRTSFSLERRGLLATANGLSLTAMPGWGFTVSLSQVAAVLKLIEQCQDSQLQALGIDLAEARATPKTDALGEAERWITNDDFPLKALQQRRSGITTMLWRIGTDGRVSNCKVVETSGSADFDTTACALITRRGHYTPAKDEAGRPVATYSMRRVLWLSP